MRNLKRALSLLLSSTMVLGMVVMGGSAAGYQDVDASNDNQEAIEVLQAVGIMSGVDAAGNFNPDGSLTRNEMAVVMAHLLNLDYDYYRGVNTFTDVPEWAAPYVAACVAEGVTAGVGNGLYGGDQKITAAQAGLMVMKALGYFQNQEDFGGDWQVATIRQASYIDLFNKVNSNAESALTRGQVAQLVLNGLKAKMVDFTGDKGIQIGDVTVGYRAEYTAKTSAANKYNTIDDGTTNIAENDQYYVQLGEELYNGDLKLSNDGMDDFGRPSRVWSYKSDEIGTYAKNELIREEYTTEVTGSDMYNLLGNSVVKDADYSLAVYVDGSEYTAPAGNNYSNFTKTNFTRNNAADLDNTGKGVLTQVFVDTQSEEITVAIINTYLAKATADYNSKTEKLAVKVYDDATGESKTLQLADFPSIESVKEGDFLLVNWADESANASDKVVKVISDVKAMNDVTVTKFSANGTKVTSMTVDGTKYDSAAKLFYEENTLEEYNLGLLTNKTYNIYLDQYGYAIGAELYSGDDQYVFITGYDLNGSNIANQSADAAAIFTDGKMATIKVDVKETNTNIDTYNSGSAHDYDRWQTGYGTGNGADYYTKINTWYTYTLDESNSVYTLAPVAAEHQMAVTPRGSVTTINSKNVRLDGHNVKSGSMLALHAYGNDDSIYITVDTDTVNGQVNVIDEVTGMYTGVQNVDISSRAIGDLWTVYAITDSKDYVIASVVIGEDNGSSSNYTYIFSGAKSEEKIGDTYYWEFDAVVEGQIQTLQVKTKYASVINTIKNTLALANAGDGLGQKWANGYLFKLSYDADGYVVNAKKYEDATANRIFINDAGTVDDWDDSITDQIIRYMNVGTSVGGSGELVLISNTLYNKSESADVGLPLHPDAKFIVAQDEYGKFVKTEYDDIQAALDALADYDTTNADGTLDFNGTISAVLDNSGRAIWVVFDSNGGIAADQNPGGTTSKVSSANVALSGDQNDVWLNLLDKNGDKIDTTEKVKYTVYWRNDTQGSFDVFETNEKTFHDIANGAIVTGIPDNSSWYVVVEGMDDATNTITKLVP